ncbi:hypothetical protein PENTCL1PPCAC_13051, partial [Pristionchus entomophagus]
DGEFVVAISSEQLGDLSLEGEMTALVSSRLETVDEDDGIVHDGVEADEHSVVREHSQRDVHLSLVPHPSQMVSQLLVPQFVEGRWDGHFGRILERSKVLVLPSIRETDIDAVSWFPHEGP